MADEDRRTANGINDEAPPGADPYTAYDDFTLPAYVGLPSFQKLPWVTDADALAHERPDVAICTLTPDRALTEGQFRQRAHLVVMSRVPDDFMTTLFQESRFVGNDQILASCLLIKIVNQEDLHQLRRLGVTT